MRRRGDEAGSTVVEFALVVPILLAIMLGILQYGYHFWALETASATAREAVRRYAVGTQTACTQQEARDHAASAALGAVTVTAPPASPTVGQVITVTVSFQSLDMGLFPLPHGGVVTQSASARVEYVPQTAPAC